MNNCADIVRVAYPLFQEEGGGANPTSALQLKFGKINTELAVKLNKLWHSRLPVITNPYGGICYGAEFNGRYFAISIWTLPVAANRLKNGNLFLELRRMAIADDAPKNTASRMISFMRKDITKRFPHIIKLISYQDTEVHSGTIYKASGWIPIKCNNKGMSWSVNNRKRNAEQTLAEKIRWEYKLNAS